MIEAHDILVSMLTALRPPIKMLPSVWAESNIVLPRESNALPGRLRLSKAQRGMMDAAAEPGIRTIVLKCATQTGKSLTINCIFGWSADSEAGPHLWVRPDDSDVSGFVRENLDPLIQATPRLRAIIGAGPKGLDSTKYKGFPGGGCSLVSSWKAAALAGKAIRVLICDEVDRFAQIVSGGEGEPVALARRRLQTFRHSSLEILASSPTLKGSSRITAHHAKGDCREFFVQCPACDEWDDITEDRLSIEDEDASTARLKCLCCNYRASEIERLAMIAQGEWRATKDGEAGVASFHLPELASDFSSLETVAILTLAAKTLEAKKVLQNTTWGLEYEPGAEVPLDAGDLFSRAVTMEAPYDAEIGFVTCGIDIQKNRIELCFLAHGIKANKRWLLDHITLPGDTSGSAVWDALDAVLATTFHLKGGRVLPLSATFIDANYQTQLVVEFIVKQREKSRRMWPIFGRDGWDRQAIKQSSRIRDRIRGYIVGVDNLKLNITKALGSSDPDLCPILLPDHMDQDWYQQLTAERLELRYVKGYPRHTWTKEAGARNEALDCLVYAVACASLPGIRARAESIAPSKAKPTMGAKMIAIFNKGKGE